MSLLLGLELEDIDHIFERGGITGGVWETRGKTVERKRIVKDVEETDIKAEDIETIEMEKIWLSLTLQYCTLRTFRAVHEINYNNANSKTHLSSQGTTTSSPHLSSSFWPKAQRARISARAGYSVFVKNSG